VIAGGGVAAAVALSGGSNPAQVTPNALITTFLPGELRQVPNACGTVPSATVQRYLPGKVKTASPLPVNGSAESACNWTLDSPPVWRLLELDIYAYAPSGLASGDGSATNAAKDAYASKLQDMRNPSAHSPDPRGAVTTLSGLGDQAFSATQVFRGGGSVTDVATVVVRYHNVIVTATLNGLQQSSNGSYGPVSKPQLSAAALAFAEAAEAALLLQRRPATRLGGVLVVGFDTATAAVSVALHDGTGVVAEAFAADGRRHGELLVPMITKVMADVGASRGDLTGVAVGVGPGPYTGLRVGVVTARVLGAVLGIPVHGMCSLDVIAADVPGGREFVVATDARRREVYWARYDAAGRRVAGPAVGQAASIPGAAGLPVAGTGGVLYPEAFGEVISPASPDARTLCAIVAARLGGGPVPAARAAAQPPLLAPEPLYLRRPDAREPGPPKRVTPS
jgi:tRNA threonylcarbamoyl adenosine modification protein YeaZ